MRMPDTHPAASFFPRRANGPRGSSSTNTNRICARDIGIMSPKSVKSLATGTLAAGAHAVSWDGTDESGRRVESGVYFCRLESGGSARAAKLVLGR